MSVQSLGWEDTWRRAWQPTPVFLPREPGRMQSMGSQRVRHHWSDLARMLMVKVESDAVQYCIVTWNVRSMSQGKLDMVKQETPRVNMDSLGISELKWTGMGKFNSNDQYIYYCGQEFLRRNGVALIVNKSPKCSICLQSQKCHNDLGSFPRQTIQHHSNPSLSLTTNAKETEVSLKKKLNGFMKTYKTF